MIQTQSGFCSKCRKIWTLDTAQGVCRWCGQSASRQTTRTTALRIKSSSRRRRKQAQSNGNGYDQLQGEYLTYYKVASRYEAKIPVQDRDDFRHDTMIELDRATKRDGKPLPELRAYRIASLMVALYYRELHRWDTRVCIWNGYPTDLHCKECQHREGKPCAWLAVRPVERLDGEVMDDEGYRVKLLDTVATDQALDLPDRWYDLNEVMLGLPLRLVEIASKRLEGKPLTHYERNYLWRWRKREQKTLF